MQQVILIINPLGGWRIRITNSLLCIVICMSGQRETMIWCYFTATRATSIKRKQIQQLPEIIAFRTFNWFTQYPIEMIVQSSSQDRRRREREGRRGGNWELGREGNNILLSSSFYTSIEWYWYFLAYIKLLAKNLLIVPH